MDRLAATGKPIVWVALGNPYVLRVKPEMPTYLCTFGYSDVSQIAAAKAISGEIPITGRLPISIPGCAKFGDGLQVPRIEMTLKRTSPEASGADRRVLKVPEGILKLAVEARTIRRAIFAIGSEGSLGFVAYPGVPESETREVDWYDARFDLGSLSQAVGTTTAAMLLVDSGKLLLGARVRDYLPEFQGAKKEMVRVHHLLAHASGLPDPLPGLPEKPTAAQLLRAACSAPLEFEPGKKTKPSAADMVLLDEIIARASGRMAGQLLASRLFTPLGLKGTSYRAAAGSDEGKSLWSTPYDLAVFSQWLLNRGIYNHRRYVNPDTIARFTGAPAALPEGRSLGWSKPSPEHWTGRVFSASAFGYDAANGCSLWIDPETHTFIVFLAEPARPDAKLDDLRRSIFEKMLLEGQIR
jgi:CubicO group peptidase (beta-lactamase class C family)